MSAPGDMVAADERARARWRRFVQGPLGRGDLVAVHAANKYLLLAHSPVHYRRLGRLVAASPRTVPIEELVARYQAELADALATPPTVGKHTNVLQHLAGYLRGRLPAAERAEVNDLIASYRLGRVPLARPLALIARHASALGIDYLLLQTYLGSD